MLFPRVRNRIVFRGRALAKKIGKPVAKRSMAFVNSRPKLRQYIIGLCHRLGFYEKIRRLHRRLHGQSQVTPFEAHFANPQSFADLSPRARQFYADLKAAIERNKGID